MSTLTYLQLVSVCVFYLIHISAGVPVGRTWPLSVTVYMFVCGWVNLNAQLDRDGISVLPCSLLLVSRVLFIGLFFFFCFFFRFSPVRPHFSAMTNLLTCVSAPVVRLSLKHRHRVI